MRVFGYFVRCPALYGRPHVGWEENVRARLDVSDSLLEVRLQGKPIETDGIVVFLAR